MTFSTKRKSISILGTRGIPAAHGGFETFAEALALYLTGRGWNVSVYCQEASLKQQTTEMWEGIRLIKVPCHSDGKWGSLLLDLKSSWQCSQRKDELVLALGYNFAVFNVFLRLRGVRTLINMDGIEWKREKWSLLERLWFWANEWIGAKLGHHLIADHPEIKTHLMRHTKGEKITMIPYGAPRITDADIKQLESFDVQPDNYGLLIGRPEPENNILTAVKAFVQSAKPRTTKLVVLGNFTPETNAYHAKVMAAADDSVLFPGAIYESKVVQTLRFYARYYVHGHSVGGTNPSLVEALGAGNAVIAHDNPFNRWVIGEEGLFFDSGYSLMQTLNHLHSDDTLVEAQRVLTVQRHGAEFTWDRVLKNYERVLDREWGKLG